MFSWEWENFEDIVKSHRVVVNDPGPLKNPIDRFTIRRDADLQLVMFTHGPVNAKDNAVSYPLGTVRENTDRVTFVSNTGLQLIAEGVHATMTRTLMPADSSAEEMQQECSIHRLKGSLYPSGRETKYVIEWLCNVTSSFHWPDMMEDIDETKKVRKLSNDPLVPVMTASNRADGSSWSCVRLTVDGCTLFLCNAKPDVAAGIREPGYIVYLGNPSDDFRGKVRTCLSFALGSYLVTLGHSRFCEDWKLIQFEAVSAYSMSGRVFELPPMPPSPLSSQWEWKIDRDVLSRAVNALYRNYDDLSFGTASWAYWHAVAAAAHVAGAHFGAVIQSLERAYLDTKGATVRRSLLDKEEWNALRSAFESSLTGAHLKEDVVIILKNKLSNLNSAPQSVVTENILSSLGLIFGTREKKAAAAARNISAHGKDNEVDAEWIRDLKILRIRFHRMIIAMTDACDLYYDYFTIGRPVRRLAEPIPE